MKNIFLFLGLVSFLATSILSCRPKESISADNDIQFDSIRTVRNYHIDNDSTKPSCNLKVTFVYPSACPDQATLDSLRHIFISCFFDDTYAELSPQEALNNYEENYIENYKEDFKIFSQDRDESNGPEIYSSYYEINSNEITFNKDGIVCFQITQTNNKGGAASYDLIKNYAIDLKNLQLIDERDIFNEGYEKALNKVFTDYLLKTKKVKSISELENIGYFGLDEMIPNGNFILDNKGITYIFNKGEYSSLKTDPIKIFVKYSDIAPLVKENSIISKFVSL